MSNTINLDLSNLMSNSDDGKITILGDSNDTLNAVKGDENVTVTSSGTETDGDGNSFDVFEISLTSTGETIDLYIDQDINHDITSLGN